jgi:methylmalonyl-CoA mutase N-terminal domain/subunit
MDEAWARDVLAASDFVQAARWLAHLDEEDSARLLGGLPAQSQRNIREALEFPVGTAGRLMDQRVTTFREETTIDEALERKQIERIRALRAGRDVEAWRAALNRVKETAGNGDNLVPAVIDAVEKNCTVGEISNQLREVFGEHRETVVL